MNRAELIPVSTLLRTSRPDHESRHGIAGNTARGETLSDRENERLSREGMSRRSVLQKLGLAGAALAASPAILAACGDDSGGSSATTGGGGGAATSAAGGGAGTTADGSAEGAGTQLASLLKIDPATSGKGMTFKMGNVLALTGSGSFYGKTMSRGIDLAVEQIKAAGGPDFQVKYYDHKSGDAAAGQQAITELGEAKYPAKLASYVDDLGAMLAGTAQYKMFTLDGGGGTSIFGQAQPYFWGTRAITPDDPLPGLFKWTKTTYPNAKTIGLTGWDIGEPNNSIIKKDILQKIADAGYTHNGLYELFPVGTQDFSAVFPKLKANEPDILLFGGYGQDP